MARKIKIYTKAGDAGKTSLIGGKKVPKYHIRIEAYGTTDELNSHIGLIRDNIKDKHYRDILLEIQHRLLDAGSLLACENKAALKKLPQIKDPDIQLLEKEIDIMNSDLPELDSFIIPGGNTVASYCHIARCVCRRTERIISFISEHYPVDELILTYFNRLSDYLFVLARKTVLDNGGKEIPRKARKQI
jgi:cob(I)alamin adenosyltransferase